MKKDESFFDSFYWKLLKTLVVIILLIMASILVIPKNAGKDITPQVTSDVYYHNGEHKKVNSNSFGLVNNDDKIVLHVKIPKIYQQDNAVLRFTVPHATITASYQGKVLYKANQELKKDDQLIGTTFPSIPIPQEAWGHSIDITIVSNEDAAFSKVNNIYIYNSSDSHLYITDQNPLSFIVGGFGIFTAILLMIIVTITQNNSKVKRQAFYLGFSTLSLSLWLFCYIGGYTLLSESQIWRHLEYIGLFSSGLPLLLYIHSTEKYVKGNKMIFIEGITLILNIILIVTSIILNTTNIVHYSRCLLVAHIILFLDVVVLFIYDIKRIKLKQGNATIQLIGIIILLLFGVYDLLRYNLSKYLSAFVDLNVPSLLAIGILGFVVCFIMSYINDLWSEKQTSISLQEQLNVQMEHYRLIEEKNNEVSTYRHDMKNHLLVIDSLLNENNVDDAVKYLNTLTANVANKGDFFQTGNPTLDAILTQKQDKCRKENIKFVADVHIAPHLKIDQLDCAKIFGNIYDNAIESCQKEINNPVIKTSLITRNDSLIGKISNTCSVAPIVNTHNEFITHKQDHKHHGFGIKSIKSSIDHYGGSYSFGYDNGEFIVSFMIPQVAEKPEETIVKKD